MARKRVKQRAAVGQLGKMLTRRSKGRCELCKSKDQVRLYELAPFPTDPEPHRTLCVCERCRSWLEQGEIASIEAGFLHEVVWSDEPAVRLASARLLMLIDFDDNPWIRDTLDAVGFDPTTSELLPYDEHADP
ncbi:MAG: hypothetical protein ACI9MC_000234 [Kiritimatiellia bacterium]|jgi:hypothetical protein